MKRGSKPALIVKKNPSSVSKETGTSVVAPSPAFTKALAREIVKNLTAIGRFTTKPFQREPQVAPEKPEEKPTGEYPILVDTSVFIDGRIIPIVQSGFFSGTLVVIQPVLEELQHIADSADALRRAKGRRGLEAVNTLKRNSGNVRVKCVVSNADIKEKSEVDAKLAALAKLWGVPLLTVDFNLAQVAKAGGVKVLNISDLTKALRIALIPGEEVSVMITHVGKERRQGVGYLPDGTMVVVEDVNDKIGQQVTALITKVHQTPAGQLFFARGK
jgi:uncharacterized protein YacL